jgi:hypothetical protein
LFVEIKLLFDLEFGFGVNLVHVGILFKKEFVVKIFTNGWWFVLCEINLVKKVTWFWLICGD